MSLLWVQNPDIATADDTAFDTAWTGGGGFSSGYEVADNGRFGTGTYSWNHQGNAYLKTPDLGVTPATIIAGCAVYKAGFWNTSASDPNSPMDVMSFYDGSTRHIYVHVRGCGLLTVKNNAGTVLGTSVVPLKYGRYAYVECKVFIHDTTGTVEVRINGETVINLTSQDTYNNSGSAQVTQVAFGENHTYNNSSGWRTTDWYVCDTTGGVNDDFLGCPAIRTIRPTGVGNYSQFTPSAGSNWENVDDTDPDDDTTYNDSSAASDRDSFASGDINSLGVYALQVINYAKATAGGTHGLTPFVRLSSTDLDGSEDTLSTSYGYFAQIFEAKPGGGSWTTSDVNSVEIGYLASTVP